MIDLIRNNLKEMNQLQNSIKLNKLDYKGTSVKIYNFSKISLPIINLRHIHIEILSIENADKE